MDWLQALILGLVQGLTEYLPVSSSGHLAIGSYLFGIEGEENLAFTVAVHVATVLSTLVILWKEIDWIFRGLFKMQLNDETRYVINIIISMIPVGIVGVFFKDTVENIFGSGLLIVGVMPGLSRSGSTIATGLLLGNKKETLAQFSFLMVIPPILGEALLDILKAVKGEELFGGIDTMPLIIGFLAAFISGCLACQWMINVVKKGKLIYFGIYCAIVGAITIACSCLP